MKKKKFLKDLEIKKKIYIFVSQMGVGFTFFNLVTVGLFRYSHP